MTKRVNMNLVLIGDGACGLTAMIRKYLFNEKYENYIPTILDEFYATVSVVDFVIYLRFIDTAGQEEFSNLRTLLIEKADAVLIGYSCTSFISVENVEKSWFAEARRHTSAPCVIVGNKLDLYEKHNPDHAHNPAAKKVAKRLKLRHLRCSAFSEREDWHVRRVFEAVILESLIHKGLLTKKKAKKIKSTQFRVFEAREVPYTEAKVKEYLLKLVNIAKKRGKYDNQTGVLCLEFLDPENDHKFWTEEVEDPALNVGVAGKKQIIKYGVEKNLLKVEVLKADPKGVSLSEQYQYFDDRATYRLFILDEKEY